MTRRNFYDPDNENVFYAPDPQYLDRLPDSPECESTLGTIRIAGDEITPTPVDIFSKTAVPKSIRRVVHLIAKKKFDDAASMLSEIILDRDSLIGPPHLTLVRVLTKAMRNNSILEHVKTAVGQGRCGEAEYRLIAASCLRDAGKYANALSELGDLGDGLPIHLRRGIEIERSHATVLQKGSVAAASEILRLQGIFPKDSIVATICRYLLFVGQRPDFSDTLLPKECTPRAGAPAGYALRNYPNPFNPTTRIVFSIPKPLHVRLKICDIFSREVAALVDETRPAGMYEEVFDASAFPSGTYFAILTAGGESRVMKMTLVK